MDKPILKRALPHIVAVLLFILLPSIYFSPQLQGEKLNQHDTNTATGMAKEIADYNKSHADIALWTDAMFGGMPAYLIAMPTFSMISPVYSLVTLFDWRPISFIFLYLLGFYLALLLFGLNPWICLIGALSFGFTSYNFIIIAAGHNTKAIAIGFMAPIIGSLFYAWKKNKWVGSSLFALFLALQIYANHLQITYYTMLTILIWGIVELYFAYKNKTLPTFLKTSGIVALFAILAVCANMEKLWTVWEYGNFSIRGKSELTSSTANQTSGLDKDYATGWSYGVDETLTLLIPNFKGGASMIDFGENSETAKLLKSNSIPNAASITKQLPGYWGTQPGTSGPVYVGALTLFLFVLALFLLEGPIRIWIIAATIFSIALAWGRNFMPLTDLFLDYFPGYNKFRTVSMILVIASFTIPLSAALVLQQIFYAKPDPGKLKKALAWSTGITAGLAFLFVLIPGLAGNFVSANDAQMPDWIQKALAEDRTSFLRTDALRSMMFILIGATLVFAYISGKIKPVYALSLLGFLILVDMWGVDKRYLNNDNFVQERKARNPYPATAADKEILIDKSQFRVLNLSVDPFSDVSTSYYHASIGGYHGAKMKRYQELIDRRISSELNLLGTRFNSIKTEKGLDSLFIGLNALNMLNTKYLIYKAEAPPVVNTHAKGAAWLVSSYKFADNADQEIAALENLDLANQVVINKKYSHIVEEIIPYASQSKLTLKSYSPNQLVYSYSGKGNEIGVFSEIYYPKGWNAYIDNKLFPHFQVNYVLRAMVLPPGSYEVTFKFEPVSYKLGKQISMISSILLLLLIGYFLYVNIKKKSAQ